MKSIFYLLTILFLSLLISCSEEPPTSVESEILAKKPPKDPPPPPEPLDLTGNVHIISTVDELIRGKYRSSLRVWTGTGTSFNPVPQIREFEGTQTKVAIYDNDGAVELLVYNYSLTGRGRNQVENFELQIWRHDEEPEIQNLDEFLYLDIVIGELDGNHAGDEIVLGGFHMGAGPEIRVFNPNFDPGTSGFFNTPIKEPFNTGAYGAFGRPVIIGDVAGTDGANEIIFRSHVRTLAVLDYSSGAVKTYDTNEQVNAIAVGYVENGLDEIIWGGISGEIHILEFDGTNFNEKWVSEDLGGQIWSLAAGNFDEDSEYEIAVTTSPGDNQGIFYVFDYFPGSSNPPVYTKTTIEPIGEGTIARMFAGNANNNPAMKKDLVVGTSTSVKVYNGLNGYTPPLFNVDIGAIVREIYLK